MEFNRITVADDLDPEKIVRSGQSFRATALPDGLFRFVTGGHVLYIRKDKGRAFDISCSPDEWQRVWHDYFDLDRRYADVRRTIPRGDAFMSRAANEGIGLRVLRQEPFEMLITAIITQRKSIPAIRRTVELLCEALGEAIETPFETLRAFPSPTALASAGEDVLKACGAGYRVPYILDAARRVDDGRLDLSALCGASDEEALDTLKTVYGVGEKVARCVLLFAYGRTSAVPVDTWIRRIIDDVYGGVDPFPAYGENAGIVQQYAFDYAVRHKRELTDTKG